MADKAFDVIVIVIGAVADSTRSSSSSRTGNLNDSLVGMVEHGW